MKRAVLFAILLVACFAAFTGIALAASPQDIYNDYLADGKLDGTYTPAELRAYLNDATLDQYGDPTVLTALDGLAQGILSNTNQGGHDEFPFTGFQLVLMGLAVVALVGGGFTLRRLGRSRD
jgi:hypothetical protein